MKLLTGKCKEDFEKFLINFYYNQEYETKVTAKIKVASFYNYPIEMQWGVIQDFADSKGCHIIIYQMDYQNWFGYRITSIRFMGSEIIKNGVWRRKECMDQAIKQFNKLYNISN